MKILKGCILNYLYIFSGYQLDINDIQEAAVSADVYPTDIDYLTEEEKGGFVNIIPEPEKIPSSKITEAFRYLKRNFNI